MADAGEAAKDTPGASLFGTYARQLYADMSVCERVFVACVSYHVAAHGFRDALTEYEIADDAGAASLFRACGFSVQTASSLSRERLVCVSASRHAARSLLRSLGQAPSLMPSLNACNIYFALRNYALADDVLSRDNLSIAILLAEWAREAKERGHQEHFATLAVTTEPETEARAPQKHVPRSDRSSSDESDEDGRFFVGEADVDADAGADAKTSDDEDEDAAFLEELLATNNVARSPPPLLRLLANIFVHAPGGAVLIANEWGAACVGHVQCGMRAGREMAHDLQEDFIEAALRKAERQVACPLSTQLFYSLASASGSGGASGGRGFGLGSGRPPAARIVLRVPLGDVLHIEISGLLATIARQIVANVKASCSDEVLDAAYEHDGTAKGCVEKNLMYDGA